MAITVEDGTGLANADSLVSVAAFKAYSDDRGFDYSAYDDTGIEQALRRASTFLTRAYRYQGHKVNARDQAMAWPRHGVVDADGWAVASDAVPVEIVHAVCEVTQRELATPGALNPDVTFADRVVRERVGDLEVEYANAKSGADASRPILLIVRDLIVPFLDNSYTGTLLRV